MTHLYDKRKPATDPSRMRTWCGRELTTGVTKNLTEVACQKCREAFAKVLRELPDVFPKGKV